MHVVLQITPGWLDLNAADVGLAEWRPMTAADQERCHTCTLVRARVQAVLGWDGSVYDHEATAFAPPAFPRRPSRGRPSRPP